MNAFVFGEEQKVVLENLGNLASIGFSDPNAAIDLISISAVVRFLDGKNSIIVVQNGENRLELQKAFEQYNLSDFVARISVNDEVEERDLDKMRQLILNLTQREALQNDDAEYRFSFTDTNIRSYYQVINSDISEGISWKSLLRKYQALPHGKFILILHSEMELKKHEIDYTSYKQTRSILEEIQYLYQKEFDVFDYSKKGEFGHSKNLVIDRLQDVTYDLFTFKELVCDLRDKYYTCLNDIENENINATSGLFNHLKDKISFLLYKVSKFEESLEGNKVSSNFIQSIFGEDKDILNTKKSMIRSAQEIVQNAIDNKILEGIVFIHNYEEITPNLTEMVVQITKKEEKIAEYVLKGLKASNKFNNHDARLATLESELESLLKAINRTKIFPNPFEINTLSFKKQISLVNQIFVELENTLQKIEKNLPYYQYIHFINEQSEMVQKLVYVLKAFDKSEWLEMYDAWYYYELLNKELPKGHKVTSRMLEDGVYFYEQWKQSDIKKSVVTRHKKIDTALSDLKTSNKEVYLQLTKKKKCSEKIYWRQFLTSNSAFLSQIYPILIMDNDDLNDLKPGFYSDIFYMDVKVHNVEILQDFLTIHSYYDIDDKKCDFEIHSSRKFMDKKISSLGMTDRLAVVKKMAKSFLSISENPIIFHLKEASIISYASDYINDLIVDKYYHLGIKRVNLDGSACDTLIVTLLDADKTVLVICEDFLLDSAQFDTYLYQRDVMSRATKLGCHFIDIDNSNLTKNIDQFELQLDRLLKLNAGESPTIQNQLHLEFN